MKTLRALLAFVCLLAIAATAAQAAGMTIAPPSKEATANAIDKLQRSGVLTPEDAACLKTCAIPPKGAKDPKVEGAKIVSLVNSMAKHRGSASDNYAENLAYLSSQKVLFTTNAWGDCEKPGNTVTAASAATLLTRLAAYAKPPKS